MDKNKEKQLQATLKEITGQPFSGLYATLPKHYVAITKDVYSLYEIVANTAFDEVGHNVSEAFTMLLARQAIDDGSVELSLAWLGTWIYTAGRIQGIRAERKRRKNARTRRESSSASQKH